MHSNLRKISSVSLFLLLYNLLVILFGAFVRATGSGAGCGAHWPLCNGEIIPRSTQVETLIEFTHRITSGLSLIFVIILFIIVFKWVPKGNLIRKAAFFSLFFTITEALVGAGLVLFELVADNTSAIRGYSIAIHLINTNLLLASISFVFLWATFGVPKKRNKNHLGISALVFVLLGLMLILGASGAITALGDTLFPSESLLEGIMMDFDPQAHFLIQLRIYHPLLAIITALVLGIFIRITRSQLQSKQGKWIVSSLSLIYVIQIILGGINVLLLAPIWMQLVHLLVADMVWILYIFYINELIFDFDENFFSLQSGSTSP